MSKNYSNRDFFLFRITVQDFSGDDTYDVERESALMIGAINKTRQCVEIIIDGSGGQYPLDDTSILKIFFESGMGKAFLRRRKRIMYLLTDHEILGKLIKITPGSDVYKYTLECIEDDGSALSRNYNETGKLIQSYNIHPIKDLPKGIPEDIKRGVY